MKVAMAFLTRDRVEQTRQSIEPLLNPDIDLHWCDGSGTPEGRKFNQHWNFRWMHGGVKGGADAAIVFALTKMLEAPYEYVGLCEQDVLLDADWFGPTMALFGRGAQDGLEVGAVSARSYQDRILIQRDGYAVMHNCGAGHIILTRKAAEIVLQHYRNPFSTENRAIFNQLCGVELARYWAFRGSSHFLTVDWGWDATLGRHGLASLALTPSAATMLEDIRPMGLQYADGKFDLLRNQPAFDRFASKTRAIRENQVRMGQSAFYFDPDSGETTYFPHQIPVLGGVYAGNWLLKWCQGFGPFGYRAGTAQIVSDQPELTVPIAGHAEFLVTGGPTGGRVRIVDTQSGYDLHPVLMPDDAARGQTMSLVVPGTGYRDINLTMLTPGCCFHGIRVREPQPRRQGVRFDWNCLPPVEEK